MKILIADDHRLIIDAVADKLSELEPGIEFVAAVDARELLERVGEPLDLALVDLSMPGADGLSHIQQVRQRCPDLPIIVLSGQEDPAVMRDVLDCGAQGYIPKAYSPAVMVSAVRLVMAGGVYVPPMLLSMSGRDAGPSADAAGQPAEAARGEALGDLLTERQVDVLRLLSQGQPNKVIGRSLGISEGTVKIHLAAIFRALNARNRTEAVMKARALADKPGSMSRVV
ncbi:MAG: response regulator transcription factor [Burkholderiales bacterium]|uniref:response regulator n=1 Tax=Ottowia sp. TaxID=1898956 RepID=UPI001AD13F32|nr:response regulator transcription factor [Ottowia sp.]MBN9404025.1 response regulator transcription factor [Burkholderiales bacterium]MBS0401715.1 response regulator transcription factor [Pseudomonadota bacterium]MBS0415909.1 response regulator transcription factor [Pseudomonadota bacterium]